MAVYARLARLPLPQLAPIDLSSWVRHVVALDSRVDVQVRGGPALQFQGDLDQLNQLLINLVRNAADAAMDTAGSVSVSWAASDGAVEVIVEDEGPGLPDPGNLFVPFFTTKAGGSGIGLALSRQIARLTAAVSIWSSGPTAVELGPGCGYHCKASLGRHPRVPRRLPLRLPPPLDSSIQAAPDHGNAAGDQPAAADLIRAPRPGITHIKSTTSSTVRSGTSHAQPAPER